MPTVSPAAERYALVGYPVAHSRSPMIHQLFARQTGEELTYELIEAEPEQFETAVLGFAAAGGKGMNVTLPHKQAAFEISRTHGAEALQARAVNTLTFKDGSIRGDNTDGTGFVRDFCTNHEQTLTNVRVLVLGAGGAARGIMRPLLAESPAQVVVANRTLERAEALIDELESPAGLILCRFDELADLGEFDVVINATSAGLKGEELPFPASLVGRGSFCYDLAYSVRPTPFVRWAGSSGAGKAVQGWGMLVEQAAESFRIWRGKQPDTGPILTRMHALSA